MHNEHKCDFFIFFYFVAAVDFFQHWCEVTMASSRQTHIAFITAIIIIIIDSVATICIPIIIIIRDIIIITIATVRLEQSLPLSPPPAPLGVNKVAVIHFFMALTVFITPQ